MELRHLRYFLVLAEELHFGRAAQRLSISQPPLSVAIQQLEDALGARLFERNSRQVRLSDAGEHLRVQAQDILERTLRLQEEVRAITQGVRGHLRLGFVGSSLYRGLPEALEQFRAEHPLVRIDMVEMNSAEQVLALQQQRLDLGLLHARYPPAGLQSRNLVVEPFMACLPQGHALAGQARLAVRSLAGERMVLFSRQVSPEYHQQIWDLCQGAGFTPDVHHEVRHWLSVLSLVSLGQGVSLVPACLQRVGFAHLAFVPIDSAHSQSAMHAVWQAGHKQVLVDAVLGALSKVLTRRAAHEAQHP